MPERREFDTTRWSVVLAAAESPSPDSREALATLCRDYWYPLYAYARRRMGDANEAQDLIQEFFALLLEKNIIASADPNRGRFRSFLLKTPEHFLGNAWAKTTTQKRGGGNRPMSLDVDAGERRYVLEPADHLTAEKLYERRWAETLLDRVMDRLRHELVRAGKQAHFDHLKVFLAGRAANVSYAETAQQLRMSEGAAMVAAHRLRKRYRELLLAEIGQTVAEPCEVEDEIRRLFAVLGD
ncbi:MAG: RNA polymerase sigma factor [Pirellulales bacterium]